MNFAKLAAAASPLRLGLLLLLLVLASATATATAQGGFRVGAGAAVSSPLVMNIHAVLPFAGFGSADKEMVLAVRADSAIVPGTVPAFGGALALMGSADLKVQPYLALGAGISFPGTKMLLTGYGVAGMHVALAGGWGSFAEAQVNFSEFGSNLRLGLGATYTFGGN